MRFLSDHLGETVCDWFARLRHVSAISAYLSQNGVEINVVGEAGGK